MPYLNISNYEVYYNIIGSGEPLILLHDGFYSSETWEAVINRLSEEFTVIVYDRYGYGKSSHIESFNEEIIEFSVNELKEFVSKLDLKEFYLCGHCLGGAIGISYAYQNQDKVKKLILESVGLYSDDLIQMKCDWIFKPFEYLDKNFRETLIKMHGDEKYAEIFWGIIRKDKKSYIMNKNYDIRDILKRLKMSIFFIYGDSDFYFDIEHAITGFKLLKKSILWIAQNTNHIVHIEKPVHFIDNIISFLKF